MAEPVLVLKGTGSSINPIVVFQDVAILETGTLHFTGE
jgi:hypothetical protein